MLQNDLPNIDTSSRSPYPLTMTQPANNVQSLRAALQGQPAAQDPGTSSQISDSVPMANAAQPAVPPVAAAIPPSPEPPVSSSSSTPPADLPDILGALHSDAQTPPSAEAVSADSAPTPPVDASSGSDLNESSDAAPSTEKSPLEVLEEILAGAEAEKNVQEQEIAKKEQEDAEFAAQLLAKQEAFAQEAEVRMQEQRVAVAQAEEHRDQVEEQLQQQGKLDPVKSTENDPFVIHQLQHETQ